MRLLHFDGQLRVFLVFKEFGDAIVLALSQRKTIFQKLENRAKSLLSIYNGVFWTP